MVHLNAKLPIRSSTTIDQNLSAFMLQLSSTATLSSDGSTLSQSFPINLSFGDTLITIFDSYLSPLTTLSHAILATRAHAEETSFAILVFSLIQL